MYVCYKNFFFISNVSLFFYTECGDTTIAGSFCKGFEKKPSNVTFDIVDDCGNVIHHLGSMDVKFTNDGGTEPFRHKFSFDLDCTDEGILNTKTAKYRKRNCHTVNYDKRTYEGIHTIHNKRQTAGDGGAGMRVNGDPSATAGVYP